MWNLYNVNWCYLNKLKIKRKKPLWLSQRTITHLKSCSSLRLCVMGPEAVTQWGLQDPTHLPSGAWESNYSALQQNLEESVVAIAARTWPEPLLPLEDVVPTQMASHVFSTFQPKCLSQAWSWDLGSPIPCRCPVLLFVSWPRWPESRVTPDWITAPTSGRAAAGSIPLAAPLPHSASAVLWRSIRRGRRGSCRAPLEAVLKQGRAAAWGGPRGGPEEVEIPSREFRWQRTKVCQNFKTEFWNSM